MGPRKAALGKTPTDVWWHTIVSPNGREKTGYATQKPRAIIDRIVKVHSNPGDILCDFFAGSGTLGESAFELGRNALLVDSNLEAVHVMKKRFSGKDVEWRRGSARVRQALSDLEEARDAIRAEASRGAASVVDEPGTPPSAEKSVGKVKAKKPGAAEGTPGKAPTKAKKPGRPKTKAAKLATKTVKPTPNEDKPGRTRGSR